MARRTTRSITATEATNNHGSTTPTGSFLSCPKAARSKCKRRPRADMAALVSFIASICLGHPVAADKQQAEAGTKPQAAPGKKRKRVVVEQSQPIWQASAAGAQAVVAEEVPENEYERERAERIKRNKAIMEQLGLQQAKQQLMAAARQLPPATAGKPTGPASEAAAIARAARRAAQKTAAVPMPTRKSARTKAQQGGAAIDKSLDESEPDRAASAAPDGDDDGLLTQQQYFALVGKEIPADALTVDGEYRGWVNPTICQQYGIAASAAEAWDGNGGGKFIRGKIKKSDIPERFRNRGWSDARAFAASQLCKNPNAYFYRHVAPHEKQAQGEWTQEEHELFMQVARQSGVGTKWGLFASYLPQRVGYQCSAYYTHVIIPSGLILDARFRMTKTGTPVFKGSHETEIKLL